MATPIGGGITNQSYRIERGGGLFVLRIGGKSAAALGIDRARELAALHIVAKLGIGAEVVFADIDEDVLVTRFLSGRPLEAREMTERGALERVAQAVRCVHDGPAFAGRFSPFQAVRNYHSAAGDLGALTADAERALSVMAAVERCVGKPDALRPCHNDLLAANLMIDGARLRIIDWEYAAMGDPFFDLANFVTNQELADAECARFIELYLDRPPSDVESARLTLLCFMSDLREGFWAALQAAQSRLDFNFHRYGARHLQRALAYASGARFLSALAFLEPNS